jgi:hypothetical protein
MKTNIIKYLKLQTVTLLLTILGVFSACKVTDIEPINIISEEAAFENPARVALAMAGVYDAAQSGVYDPLNGTALQIRGYPFGSAASQQSDMRGEDMVNRFQFYAFTYQSTYTPATANNVNMWITLYRLINRANLVIEGVQRAKENGVIDEASALAYEGECRFLRALAHHELLINFARPYAHSAGATHLGVPYRDFGINSPATIDQAASQPRNTVADCYNKLLSDLDFAETNLPATRNGAQKITRVTKGAAIALKVRVQQHKGDWAKVLAEGAKLVTGDGPTFTSPIGSYALTTTPEGPFANNAGNSESIFSLENNAADNPGTNGSLPRMWSSPSAPGTGRGIACISPNIYNANFWLTNDLRRTQLLLSGDGGVYFTNKYRDVTNQTDFSPILRYAEVLLNMAEAEARLNGVTAKAVNLLNAIRNRAVTTAADQFSSASFADGKALVQAILNERRIEFLAEGRRWADIHRLAKDPDFTINGIPAKVAPGNAGPASFDLVTRPVIATTILAIPYDDFRFLWPIPAQEVTTNPILASQQNPGY